MRVDGGWGLEIGDWVLVIGDWAQSPIPIKSTLIFFNYSIYYKKIKKNK